MDNPFQSNNIRILREAFPNVEEPVIDDILYSTNGDINEAFELLLSMNSGHANTAMPLQQQQQQHRPLPPPLQRPIHHSTSMPFPTSNPPPPSQRITPPKPKPMTVREELAQWRQDLREESRLKASRALSARSSTSRLSLSNLIQSRNKSSPQVQQRENHYHSPLRERHSMQRLSVPTSLPINSTSDPTAFSYNRSTLFTNNQPGLTTRGTNSQTTQTNPFLPPVPPPPSEIQSSRSSSRVVPLPPLPPRREEEPHSFNPFEEENDIPPPAYSEIQRDTIIQVQGHTG